MPLIQAVYEEKEQEGLVIIAIDMGEENQPVKRFVENEKLTFIIALDYDTRVARTYGIRPIPTTFLIDREGYIKQVKVGAFRSRAEIRELLNNIM